ncbi:MAG: hypothetical protein AAGJ31_15575 [Verrucomicrobiota bacterium]
MEGIPVAVKLPKYIVRPGSEEEEWWSQEAGDWERISEPPSRPKATMIGLGASEVLSLPMWVPSDDPDVVRGMLGVQLEERGIMLPEQGKEVGFWEVKRKADHVLVGAVVLHQREGDKQLPFGYQVAARLRTLPGDAMVFFRENGRWVVAFTSPEGELIHLQLLSARMWGEGLWREAHCSLEALRLRDLLGEVDLIDLQERLEDPSLDEIQRVFPGFRARESSSSWDLTRSDLDLEPESIARIRAGAVRRRRGSLACGSVLLVTFLWLGIWLGAQERQKARIDQLVARLAEIEPDAEKVRAAQARYESFRLALDPTTYPLDIYHRIMQATSGEDIHIQHFELVSGRLLIRGEAPSSEVVVDWKEKLRRNAELQDFDWEFDPPEILPSQRARFRVAGTHLPTDS